MKRFELPDDTVVAGATTKEMREIAREAKRRNYNRQMSPAQFRLLDPRGTHGIHPVMYHDHAHRQEVEPHLRCEILLDLIGKKDRIHIVMDVPKQFLEGVYTSHELNNVITDDLEKLRIGGDLLDEGWDLTRQDRT